MSPPTVPPPGTWSTGLCGCCEDINSCCCVAFCPCVAVGRNTELVTDGFTDGCTACSVWCVLQSCLGLGCCYSMGVRTRLRQKYLLPQHPCSDCGTHTFCLPCAVCQETRELKNRGWLPAIGYAANIRRFQAAMQVPTPDAMKQ